MSTLNQVLTPALPLLSTNHAPMVLDLPPTAVAAHEPENSPSLLPGINFLIEGPTGTGKTHCLGTAADAGVDLFVLFTENALETLLGYWTDRGLPVPENVHWHVLPKPDTSFATLATTANTINTMSQDALYKMNDPDRAKHNQFTVMLRALADFPDDRTGKKFGPVDRWGPDRMLAISTLTGINPIAMSLVIGGKPIKSQTDWGIAQDQIERLIRQLTDGCKCHFVLESHVEREIDPVFGGMKITVSTLGVKLAPKIPPMFSDVVLAERKGAIFSWNTAHAQADLKARNLPIAETIPPSFKPVLEKWKSRGGKFTSTIQK